MNVYVALVQDPEKRIGCGGVFDTAERAKAAWGPDDAKWKRDEGSGVWSAQCYDFWVRIVPEQFVGDFPVTDHD